MIPAASGSTDRQITGQCQELVASIARHPDGKGDGFHRTEIDRLDFALHRFAISLVCPAKLVRLSVNWGSNYGQCPICQPTKQPGARHVWDP